MSVSDGQPVNAAVTNAAFMSRTTDTDTSGKVDLKNEDAASGSSVTNLQREVNSVNSFTGHTAGTAKDAKPSWTSNDVGTSTDDLKARADSLSAKFNVTTGHSHSGAAGDGAPISASDLGDYNDYHSVLQAVEVDGVSGSSTDISTEMSGETAGGGESTEGVPTESPYNRAEIRDQATGEALEDAGGQKIYGRITESAGTWTLSYYTNESGTETSASIGSSTDITVYFRKVFTSANRPTFGESVLEIDSLDYTADIVDASATQAGKVTTSTQTFGGHKTFSSIGMTKTEEDSGATVEASGATSFISIPDTVTTVIGITSPVEGKRVVILNRSSNTVTISHEAAAATQQNRINTHDSEDIELLAGQAMEFLYDADDSRWKPLAGLGGSGSGGSSSEINYFSPGDAEASNSDSGFQVYDEGAVDTPTTGSGGSPTVTFERSQSEGVPIRDDWSYEFSKPASDCQGQGWSRNIALHPADSESSKRIFVRFEYRTDSDYVSGDMKMFVHNTDNLDVTPLIDLNNLDGELLATSSVVREYVGWFYSNGTSKNYRLIGHVTSTNSSAYDIQFDRFRIGPDSVVPGAIVTPWQSAGTITIGGTTSAPSKGTVSTDAVEWRRVGGEYEVTYNYHQTVGGSAGSGDYLFSLPSGIQFSSDIPNFTTLANLHISAAAVTSRIQCDGHINVNSGAGDGPLLAYKYSSTQFRLNAIEYFSTSGNLSSTYYNFANAVMAFKFTIRFKGESLSAGASISSSELALKSVRVSAYKNAGSSTANSAIASWTAEDEDTHGSFDASTGIFTANKNMTVFVSAHVRTSAAGLVLSIRKNGSQVASGIDQNTMAFVSRSVTLLKGDQITITPSTNITHSSDNLNTTLSIFEIPDFTIFSAFQDLWEKIAVVKEVRAQNTASSLASWSTTYATIPVNTLEGGSGWASLSSSQITLTRGVYMIHGQIYARAASGVAANLFRSKLQNVTDGTVAILGSNADVGNDGGAAWHYTNPSTIQGIITINSEKTFEFQTRTASGTVNAMAALNISGESEVYAQYTITKMR